MPEARRQTLDLSSQSSMYVQIGHKIFRSETVSNSKRGSPLSAKSFYSALLHKKDTAAIGAMHPTAVGFFRLLAQALQTHFSMAKANRNSKIGVRHSIFKTEKKNNEYRLTDDEFRFSSNGTCSIAYLTTKQRSIKNSPDCSGYNVELAQHYLSGKRDQNFIEILPFRFKKLNTPTSIERIAAGDTAQTIPLRSIVRQHNVLDYRQPLCCNLLRSFEGAVSSFVPTGKRKYR